MAFTGFYQPIQTLPSLAPQPSVLQAQFEKTAQDFMAQQANQKKMEMAQQEQQMRQTEMAAQSLERSQKAKQEQETRQKKIDEEQKKTTVLNAVRAAVMATPGMSQADQVILGKKKAFELGLPTKDIDKPYEDRLNAALKNPSPAYLPIAEEAARVLGVTFDKELFKQGYKPEEKMAVSPGQGIYNKATGTWETKPAEKPTMEQELEKARKIEEIKFGYDVKRKGIPQATNAAGKTPTGVTPAFASSLNGITGGTAPMTPEPTGTVPGEGLPEGVGMGQPGIPETVGFGVDPMAAQPTQKLQGQALIDALVAQRPNARTPQDNKYLDDLIRQEERKMAASGKVSGGGKEKLSPGAARDLAERVHAGGMSLQQAARGDEGRALVSNALHKLYVETGDTPIETDINGARFAAGKRALADNTKRKAYLEGFAETAKLNGLNAIKASREYARTGVPWANAIVEAAKGKFSPDPQLARFQQFNTAFALEMANILNNPNLVGVTPESLKRDILEMLSTADSPKVYEERINAIFQEMNNRLKSFRTTEDELIGGLRALGVKPAKPGDQIRWSPSNTPKPLPATKEDRVFGQIYYMPDGQNVKKWMGKGWAKEGQEPGGGE